MTRLADAGPRAVLRRHLLPAARRRPRRRASGSSTLLAAAARPLHDCSEPERRCAVRATSVIAERVARGSTAAGAAATLPAPRSLRRACRQLLPRSLRRAHGGTRAARRSSPAACRCGFLLRYHRRTRRRRALDMATLTPRGDGRAAASTTRSAAASTATRPTRDWLVPHFEKMLYDNALLARRLPRGAARLTGERRLRATSPARSSTTWRAR